MNSKFQTSVSGALSLTKEQIDSKTRLEMRLGDALQEGKGSLSKLSCKEVHKILEFLLCIDNGYWHLARKRLKNMGPITNWIPKKIKDIIL